MRGLAKGFREMAEKGWGELPDVSPNEQLVIGLERVTIDVSRGIGGADRAGDYGAFRHEVVARLDELDKARDSLKGDDL